jgi:hypothetical protein
LGETTRKRGERKRDGERETEEPFHAKGSGRLLYGAEIVLYYSVEKRRKYSGIIMDEISCMGNPSPP